MKILTKWLRGYLPGLAVDDAKLAEDLTLRGIAVEGIYDLGAGKGSLFEMDITTNRVDAMNHYGVAREAAAIYGLQLPPLDFPLPEPRPAASSSRCASRPKTNAAVSPRASCAASPLANRATGSPAAKSPPTSACLNRRQISNAVDATNYAWLAMGQPTHAFDLDKIEGGIVVRRARKGEQLKTLDGVDRTLDSEDLIVADHAKPLGLAGVMGGWDTMITPSTTNVLVEAAWFEPMAVRRTARRHGLHTDASHRFERGADFNAAPLASALVSSILLANGGRIEGELVDVRIAAIESRNANRKPVTLALSEVQRILGKTVDNEGITASTVEAVLKALGCGLATSSNAAWQVTLPSWRLDLEREIDLIEEVARVYGYNGFANTLPSFGEGVRALPWASSEAVVFARTADHADEPEWFVDPVLQYQGVMAMPARHNQRERWRGGWRRRGELFPGADFKGNLRRKKMMVGQCRAIVKNGDFEVELGGERSDGLGDVSRTGNPQMAGRRDGLAVKPFMDITGFRSADGKIRLHPPGHRGLALRKRRPKAMSGAASVGEDDAKDFATADQPIVPAEIVVEQQVKRGGLAGAQGLDGALLNFRLQATAAERAVNPAIGMEQCLRADLLRARPLDPRDDSQRHRLALPGCIREGLKNVVLHGNPPKLTCFPPNSQNNPTAMSVPRDVKIAIQKFGRQGRQRCFKLDSHPHAMPITRPPAWAPLATPDPRTPADQGVRQKKNQMIMMVTLDGWRNRPEPGSRFAARSKYTPAVHK